MIDNELICGTEDFEDVQVYYEKRRNLWKDGYLNNSERLNMEIFPELATPVLFDMEVNNGKEKDNTHDKQSALRRISAILSGVS